MTREVVGGEATDEPGRPEGDDVELTLAHASTLGGVEQRRRLVRPSHRGEELSDLVPRAAALGSEHLALGRELVARERLQRVELVVHRVGRRETSLHEGHHLLLVTELSGWTTRAINAGERPVRRSDRNDDPAPPPFGGCAGSSYQDGTSRTR